MEDKIISYEADLDQEYETLTEKHATIKHRLEVALSLYLKEKKAKPVTIQGPYGSGKTQLLYHLFKFTWENGGIGIYAHLEKIIPSQKMASSNYADYLKKLLNKEIDLLRKGESALMIGKVRDYAVNHIKEIV
jgi:ABC-type lipoprotein export system ATPase subunit